MSENIRIHHIIEHSTTNGPGTRFVIWTQGCPLNCDGCFNENTHNLNAGYAWIISILFLFVFKKLPFQNSVNFAEKLVDLNVPLC